MITKAFGDEEERREFTRQFAGLRQILGAGPEE
jgi:hypothetical protein